MQRNNFKLYASGPVFIAALTLSGCATQAPPVKNIEPVAPQTQQRAAQQAAATAPVAVPQLKRKIALGRITNETTHGRSLLRDAEGDPLGKQVTDMLSKALTESGAYLVFERPDISRVIAESQLTNTKLDLIGVDTLLVGSLTEFGRKNIGQTGFASASKKQVAFAKVDLRAVDTRTGQVVFATAGAGEASTETASTFGFGSQASYDGTLNDAAIRQAISEAVNQLAKQFSTKPWQTYVLKVDGETVFIGGGKRQGVNPDAKFSIFTQGEKIRSPQTGAEISLPGRQIATIRVVSNFGATELDEGSVATIESGSLANSDIKNLIVRSLGERN